MCFVFHFFTFFLNIIVFFYIFFEVKQPKKKSLRFDAWHIPFLCFSSVHRTGSLGEAEQQLSTVKSQEKHMVCP